MFIVYKNIVSEEARRTIYRYTVSRSYVIDASIEETHSQFTYRKI